MRRLLIALLLIFVAGDLRAEDGLLGKDAPALEIDRWLAAPEGASLADLRGRVVLLLLNGACALEDGDSILRWNDLRAAYVEKGLRIVAVLPKKTGDLPAAVEFSAAVGASAAYGDDDGPRAALITADGTVAWTGPSSDMPEERLPKLLRKARPFALRSLDPALKPVATAFRKGQLAAARELAQTSEHADAKHVMDRIAVILGYWKAQADRAAAAGNPAETAMHLRWIAKHLAGATEGTDAATRLKALKSDKPSAKEIKAATGYVRLRADLLRTKGKRKRIDALAKKAERFAERSKGTCGAARAARLAAAIKADPALTALRAFIAKKKVDATGSGWRERVPKPPKVTFAETRTYLWILETSEGSITLRLLPHEAPMHVSNAIYLTELGFFDGLGFHRVIPGFMAQGGSPDGTPSGRLRYQFEGEFDGDAKHDKAGTLSAANAGPGTDGCQFFITFAATAHLDGKHTVYGEVVDGLKTLKRIEKLGTTDGPLTKKVVIEKATIRIE